MVSRRTLRIFGFALWVSGGLFSLSAKDPLSNAGVRLPIGDATDRVFVPISAGKEASHAWVGQIVDDNQGFLWFGTSDSLYRYDGYQVRPYVPHADGADGAVFFQECCAVGLSRYSLFRDHSGKIWIAAGESVYQYESETEKFSHLPFSPGELQGLVRDVNQDGTGMIWLASGRGLTRYNPSNGKSARFLHNETDSTTLGSNYVRATLETRDGTFWVATNVSVDLFDRQTGRVMVHLPLRNPLQTPTKRGNPYVRLLEDRSGTVWIASARDGLAFVDRLHTKLTFLALASGSDPEPGAWTILEDQDSALWVGTERGLLRLDRDRERFIRYRNDPADPNSLPADWVLALFEDGDSGLWVGMANAGVARFSQHPLPFRRYQRRPKASDPSGPNYVFTAYEDSRGVIWAGSKGAINRIDLKTGQYTVQPIGENTVVNAIIADSSGQFWIGSGDGSLFRFNPATQKSVVYEHNAANSSGCGNNDVRALFVDHLGTLWVGSGDRLCSFDPVSNRFRVYNTGVQGPNEIDAIAEDRAGILWIGSRHAGLHRFDPATGKFTTFRHSAKEGSLSSDVVTSILVDRSGTIWAGTQDGLNRLDAATGKFTVYLAHDGLPSSNINGVVDDASGDLWITTTYGLSHFRARSRTFNNYYRSDGVLDDLTGAWKGRSGQLYFGSYDGLTVLAPDAMDEKIVTPRVVLTNFQISDKPVPVGADSPLKESISVAKALTLCHSQNILSFEFADLSYTDPERTRYRYRLGRLESGWNEVVSTQHLVRYTTLAPGEYLFQVEARTSSGDWTKKGAEVRIVILPPWWSTWQFRLACAFALGLTMWFSWHLRVRQLAKQFNLQFEERLRERTRIARDLHDTMLQSFHGMMLQFRAVYNLLPSRPAEARETLEGALDQARQAITEGRDAVLGLRESAIEANDLAQALQTLSEELNRGETSQKSVLSRIDVQGTSRDLHPIVRDEVYWIAGEALRNAFRHAQAHRIEVEVRYDERQFRLRVRDDGNGVDPKVLREGRAGHFGLPGMRERAGRIGGNLDVWSELESGTEVEVTVPGSIAYTTSRARHRSRLFGRKTVMKP